jgi:hypothetical protein
MIELETDIFYIQTNGKFQMGISHFFLKKKKRKKKKKKRPKVTNNYKFSQKKQPHTHKATTLLISNQKLQFLTKRKIK